MLLFPEYVKLLLFCKRACDSNFILERCLKLCLHYGAEQVAEGRGTGGEAQGWKRVQGGKVARKRAMKSSQSK